jgi:L-malate glycosyltransferase
MKIGYVYDTIYPYTIGGVEKRIWELAIRLTGKGHEVHIFGPKNWQGYDLIQQEGVYLHGICKTSEKRFVDGRRSIGWTIYFALKLFRPLMRERFDIIDCQNFPYFSCFSAKIVSIVRRTPLVITWIEVWGDYWSEYLGKKGILGKLVEKMTVYLSRDMIAISETTKRQLLHIGVGKGIVTAIPIGVDLEKIRFVEPSSQVSDIIFAGRLIKEKHVDILLEAVSELKTQYPGVKAVIIGEGPENHALQQLAVDLGLQDNVRFVGFLERTEDLIACMKSSKVFVFPSVREGFGIVVVEANACGLPVIVIDHPRNAACDLVVNGNSGYKCQLSADDIAAKISLFLAGQDQDSRAKCIENSLNYDWTKIIASVESVYLPLVN